MAATSPEAFGEQQEAARQARSLDAVAAAIEEASQIEVPPPVTEIVERKRGVLPKLGVDALELARQVYYLQYGSTRDAARAIIAAGLSDTDDLTQVSERLQTWWKRERWPKRRFAVTIAIRDANHQGGLYRGRLCKGAATGCGPAPKGKPCAQTVLADSDYCYHHDPRPEYEARRRESGIRMARSRDRDLVPLEPFAEWCARRREQLLKSLRIRGVQVDPKDRGWKALANEMGVNYAGLWRTINKPKRQGRDNTVRATTIARYLANLDVTFEDIYGFERPAGRGDHHTCSKCGGYKEHNAKQCRDCHDALGEPCPYVNARNETCGTLTESESGYCAPHRRIVEGQEERARNPQPKKYRKGKLNDTLLMAYALDEYLRCSSAEWVAAKMWAANVDDVCSKYARRRTLAAQIIKQFVASGLIDREGGRAVGRPNVEKLQAKLLELVAKHGPISWPSAPAPTGMKEVPSGPFLAWLEQRRTEVPGYHHGLNERFGCDVRQMVKRRLPMVKRSTVERALAGWDGTTFDDLYGTP